MGKPIIWSGTNAKLINSGDLVDTNGFSLTDGGKITVTQTGFGTAIYNPGSSINYIGAPVYFNGTAWTLADATASSNAEVIAYVYGYIDANTVRLIFNGQIATIGSSVLQGGGSLVAGTTYFLSTTPGQITATPTTVVGQINKPVGTAISTTTLELTNYRGQVVGSTNALTQISLANNATTTVQNVSAYTGGSLSGYVTIVNTTSANSLTFYVNAPFAKYGGASNYYISPSYVGDTPPSGFTMTVTSGGLIQITMPNVSGYSSASIVYGLNVPAVGTNFPLSIDGSAIVSGTVAAARLPQVSTSSQGAFPSLTSSLDNPTATQLGLKQYLHGTTYNGGNAPTVTSLSGSGTFSVIRALFIPYQMQDGTWRMRLTINVTYSSTNSTVVLLINGITFSTVANFYQSLAVMSDATSPFTASGSPGVNNSQLSGFTTAVTNGWRFSGDVELAAKPTWAY
jgi:hypothetical protein